MNEQLETALSSELRAELGEWFDRRFDQRFEAKMAETAAAKTASLSVMVTKGTLDWAYPPFIIATTAAALGWEVFMFFTFYGLNLLRKELNLNISPLGNPAMPMKMPIGPEWFRGVSWEIPNFVMAGIPGFERMATGMMKKTIREKGVASVEELRQICIESEVKLIGCEMTANLFGWDRDEFIPEVAEWAGAATYLQLTQGSDVNLFV